MNANPVSKDRRIKNPTDTAINNYFKNISRYPRLTREEEITLGRNIQLYVKINKLKQEFNFDLNQLKEHLEFNSVEEVKRAIHRGQKSHEKMVSANLRLVVFIAKSFIKKGVPLEDLVQEGNLGLFKACYKYDPNYGTRLSTYAVPWITHAIQIAIQKQSSVLYRPPSFNIELSKIIQATKELIKENGRSPNDLEVARKLNIKPSRLRQVRLLTQSTLSLDIKINDLDRESKSMLDTCFEDTARTPEEYTDSKILKEKIKEALGVLTEVERKVICLRYGLAGDKYFTISDVSSLINQTRELTRQIETRAIEKLRWPGVIDLLEDFN